MVIAMGVRKITIATVFILIGTTILFAGGPMDSKVNQEEIHKNAPAEAQASENIETATFALGCFWGPDGRFGILSGVIRTRVGYAGGTSEHPTYQNIDGHAETIQIDYDTSVISYAELLDLFWAGHEPFRSAYSSQYRSVIFFHNEQQQQLAEASLEEQATQRGERPLTEIVPFERFTRAEDYHQKYRLQNDPILSGELRGRFETFTAFVDSTPAARVNGYLAGWGSAEQLKEEIASFDLSRRAEDILRQRVK
jgi:peptide-methionine (S)-S-oxide reductase